MTFSQAVSAYWKNYAVFSGRARRGAYWYAVLFTAMVSNVISVILPVNYSNTAMNGMSGYLSFAGAVNNLWSIATLLPSLAVGVRRLHDTGRSGRYLLWALLPIVGWILLIVALAKDSEPGANKYGEPVKVDPKTSGSNPTGGTQDY